MLESLIEHGDRGAVIVEMGLQLAGLRVAA